MALPPANGPGSSFGGTPGRSAGQLSAPIAGPLLRVVNNATLNGDTAMDNQGSGRRPGDIVSRDSQGSAGTGTQNTAVLPTRDLDPLANYVRAQYTMMRDHRNNGASGWAERLNAAIRTFNGVYDAQKLRDIKTFGGSDIYARITAMKCRGANSLLRDIYLAPDRPWAIRPPADPDVPPEVLQQIGTLVQSELQNLQVAAAQQSQSYDPNMGPPPEPVQMPSPGQVRDRVQQLLDSAKQAARKQADKRVSGIQARMDEILEGGGFYVALSELLVDLPIFPYAVLKGPIVRIVPTVTWDNPLAGTLTQSGAINSQNGGAASFSKPTIVQQPRLTWERISPFDIYWTPGVADIQQASVIQRSRLTRADLNDLLDLPGYDSDAVRAALDDYGRGGLTTDWDSTDSERALQERRENPLWNRSEMIDLMEFHGNVQGRLLADLSKSLVKTLEDAIGMPIDYMRDYHVQAFVVGNYVIKVQMTPSPRQRPPFYITSFEKVPGTPVGNALPDLLSDIQDAANATLRALVNNLSIASGPQVVINDDRLAPGENAENLYPWKRWHTLSDPMSTNTQPAITFFQPNSNAAELLGVFNALNLLADDVSAIPKYVTGQGASSGAGRTASGLSMLMANASKLLQTVAGNVDRDVMNPALTDLYEMLMLTDETGMLRGDETIRVMGVNVAIQRETQRVRQLEFLSITANPLDAPIIGPKGRAAILREVAQTIGMDGEKIIPDEDEINRQEQIQRQQIPVPSGEAAANASGTQAPPQATMDSGPRTRLAGGVGG